MTRTAIRATVVVALLGLFAAALPQAAAAPATDPAPAALLGGTSYWQGFVEYWTGAVRKQNGVVMMALGLGAVCLFIITRAKWKK